MPGQQRTSLKESKDTGMQGEGLNMYGCQPVLIRSILLLTVATLRGEFTKTYSTLMSNDSTCPVHQHLIRIQCARGYRAGSFPARRSILFM